MGGITFGQVILGGTRKQDEQICKQHPFMVVASIPIYRLLAWLPLVMDCGQDPFPTEVTF